MHIFKIKRKIFMSFLLLAEMLKGHFDKSDAWPHWN